MWAIVVGWVGDRRVDAGCDDAQLVKTKKKSNLEKNTNTSTRDSDPENNEDTLPYAITYNVPSTAKYPSPWKHR